MKNKLSKSIAAIALSLLMVNCAKEQTPNIQNEIPANDLRLAKMIKNFKAKGESGLKSSAEMSVDSAIWYIGATANFTYGDASRETERTWTDSIFISLPVNNGKITESEVFNKYEQVIDSLRAIYQAKNEENKQLLAVAVETHSLSSTALVCKVTGVFAAGILSTTRPLTFNDFDSWFFWLQIQGGICNGPNSGTNIQSDAAEETQKRITNGIAVPNGTYWYEALPTVEIRDAIPIDPNSAPSNQHYSYLYWNSSQYTGFDGCINPNDLNFYLTKTKELIYKDTNHNGLRPIGSCLIGIDMWGHLKSIPPFTIYLHRADVFYGILHWSPNNPEKLD